MARNIGIGLLASAGLIALAACGGGGSGGGGSGIVSTPSPTPTPPPTPTPTPPATAAVIFDSPATQQFAAYNVGPGNLQIRYDASSNLYQVNADASGWQDLRGTDTANYFEFGATYPAHWLSTEGTPSAFEFSRIGAWSTLDYADIAFGIATPNGGVPITGSATFNGVILGESDVCACDGAYPGWDPVGGSIALAFDFAAGSLSGSINPVLYVLTGPSYTQQDLGTFTFKDTVFGAGSTSFSGAFNSNAPGPSAFSGIFTGPNAEELIGEWALPFTWSGDNQAHWAAGVMAAKR